jgi:hypothetical protein
VTIFLTLLDVILSMVAVVMASWALLTAEEVEREQKHLRERVRFLEQRGRR